MKRFLFTRGVVVLFIFTCSGFVRADEANDLSWEEKYSDRPAVYLLRDTTLEVKADWSFQTRTHYKVKIQKEEAKSWGEIPINYDKSREKISGLKAYTITPDGKRHKYSKIQDFRVYRGYPMYSDYMVKIITMPEVVVGSIIEYESTKVTRRLPIKDNFWYYTYIDPGIPVKENRVTVILPKKLAIAYKEFNLEYKPTIKEDSENIIYSWHLEDLDEEEYEEFIPPPDLDDIENCVEFSSIKSWKDISDWYYRLVKENMITDRKIEDKVEELVKDKEKLKDKVRTILEYIQDDFRYVSMSFGDHALQPHPADQVFGNKYGDCKDLSLLCMAMLKIAGIKSNIALFNDEFSITDPQYDLPFPTLFNHVLLLVDDSEEGDFYIDPLLDGYDIGEYPGFYQAAYTFLISEDGGRFGHFSVFDDMRYYSRLEKVIEIKNDGSAATEVKSLWDLDFSIEMRNRWEAMSQDDREKFLRVLETRTIPGGKMIERRWENIDARYGQVESFIRYEDPRAYPITDDMIIINAESYSRSFSFSEEEREKPIFFPTNSLDERTTTFFLPEGFKVTYLPENLDLDIGFFNYKRNYEIDGNRLTVKTVTRSSRQEIPVEKYSAVKDFYDQLPQKTTQRIMIKKTKPWWQGIKNIFKR